MADLEKTVKIIFSGQDSSLAKKVGDIQSKFGTLNQSVTDASEPFKNLTSAVFKVDAALAVLAAGSIAMAVKKSAEFNQGFALISTSVDATGKDLDVFKEQVIDYGTKSTKTYADINAALYTAAQAGVKYTDSLDFIAKSEQLAVANNANLNTTVDLLTGTMNAYGYSIQDVGHLNDVFFQSTLIGKQTIDELGQSMGQVVGIAANAGVSFEDLQAAIATLTAKGMNTSDAITAIKGAITAIISPSAEASKAASALGLNFSASSLQAEGFSGMMTKIMNATGGSTDKMTELFSEVRSMNGVLSLTGDNMAFFNDALNQVANSSGAAEVAYQKMVGTFKNQFQTLENIIDATLIGVGSRIEPILAQVTSAAGGLFAGLKSALDSGAFDPVFNYLSEMGAKLADQLKKIASNLPAALEGLDFSPIINALKSLGGTLGGAFSDLFGEIDLTTTEGLHKALQKIVDVIGELIKFTGDIVSGMRPFIKMLGEAASGAEGTSSGFKELAGKLTGFMTGVNLISNSLPILTGAISLLAVKEIPAIMTAFTGWAAVLDAKTAPALLAFSNSIIAFMSSPAGLVAMGVALTAVTGYALLQKKEIDALALTHQGNADAINKATLEMVAQGVASGKLTEFQALQIKQTMGLATAEEVAAAKAKEHSTAMSNSLPLYNKLQNEIEATKIGLTSLSTQKTIKVDVQADGTSIETAYGMVIEKFPDGAIRIVQVDANADEAKLEEAKKKIEKEIPAEKLMEIQANVDIARIKEQSAIIQSSMEWKAKVDIAQIESATKKIEVMFQGIDNTISSTGNVLSDLFGSLTESGGTGFSNAIEEQIRRENDYREQALNLQKTLVEAEVDEIRARTKLMNEGKDIGIKVSADGLAPHLEAIWFEVLSAIQVRATAEGIKMLV